MRSSKAALRAQLKARIAAQDEDARRAADGRIAQRVLALPEYRAARCVLLYISVGLEVDTRPIVQDAFASGKRVCVPRCLEDGIMEAAVLASADALVPGEYGIPSAPEDADVVPPDDLDFVLVPGLGFDADGGRIGRGGGYYDRYLKRVSPAAATVGVCRTVQCVPRIPCEETDCGVKRIIME